MILLRCVGCSAFEAAITGAMSALVIGGVAFLFGVIKELIFPSKNKENE